MLFVTMPNEALGIFLAQIWTVTTTLFAHPRSIVHLQIESLRSFPWLQRENESPPPLAAAPVESPRLDRG